MPNKLTEKFTEKAKGALSHAAKEAEDLNSGIIETEHILLGILDDDSSTGFKVLSSFQLDKQRVKESVLASADPQGVQDRESGFSDSSQEAIASAALQAYLWGSSYVGTEHLLCGLSKTPSGLACHILRSWGITYETLKARVANYINPVEVQNLPKESTTPLLNNYSRDLTALAREDKLDPVIRREEEISRLIQILCRRTKNNPVLLGDAGVGKTAIVEGLAQRIVNKAVPEKIFNTRIASLDINAMVAGTRFRGDFEERVLGVLEEIKEANNIIIFIDEIQTIIGAGGAGGALDAANILKPALARGDFRCIGATTTEEYSQFIEEDSALERRFQPIFIQEPDTKTAVDILEGLKNRYEAYHKVSFKKEAINASVKLAQRYLLDRHLPDSAIDLIDEAASKKAVSFGVFPKKALRISDNLQKLRAEKDLLVKEESWQKAYDLLEKEKKFVKDLSAIINKQKIETTAVIDEPDIAEVVSQMTGIPLKEITTGETKRLLNLENELSKKVVGQDHVLRQVAGVLRRSRVGLRDPKRPVGSFILLGSSGVGKTLVAETLAETLFESPESLIRLNMSEFSESHTVSRLLGSPPGYVGYEEGGELTIKLRQNPYCVILLDELEKANKEIFNILLQVLDNGQLMDGKGRLVNFRNSIIIMTSNVGSHLIRKEGDIGFRKSGQTKTNEDASYRDLSQKLKEELRRNFKLEFLNRVDSVLVFKQLSKHSVKRIAKLLVKEVILRLQEEQDMMLSVEEKVYDFLVEKGFSSEFGAREMRRVITENIEDPLSEGILSDRFKKGQPVKIRIEKGSIILK